MTRQISNPNLGGPGQGGADHRSLPTILDVARERAARTPDETAFTFLVDGEQQTATYTFGGLDRRARAVATELAQRSRPGSRALVVLEPGLDYIAALYGCFYAGVIPAPVYPPDPFRIARTLPRLQAIFTSAECDLLISSEAILGGPEGALRRTCPNGAVAVEAIADVAADEWRPRDAAPQELALLQYTSGTTGEPRGVPITHANLIDNLRGMEQVLDVDDAVALEWLPPYHDLGLIGGVFLPLFAGRHSVLMSPLSFMQKPARWLQAIAHYRATTSAAPNFGYELCLRKIGDADCEGLDLSSWRVAVSGAEPVRADTLDRFVDRFAPYGFRREAFVPAYGMAETTLMVSVARLGTRPRELTVDAQALAESRVEPASAEPPSRGRRLVGCGPPGPGVELKIVDPDSRRETDGVGEVWVRGHGVASGYWRSPERSSTHFNQTLANGISTNGYQANGHLANGAATNGANGHAAGYLRTGDLGFMEGGELFLVGRRKEMILLAGRNFYPHDIEASLQSAHEAFKTDGGAAVAVEADNAEHLVLFQEVQRPRRQDLEGLLRVARQIAAEETGQQPWRVVLLPVGELPKTSSGKTRRAECWQLYESGSLTVLAEWPSETANETTKAAFDPPTSETERWLAACWADVLGLVEVGRGDNFFALGGRSLQLTQMLTVVADRTGLTLPLKTLFDHPTLAALAGLIDQHPQQNGAAAPPQTKPSIDPTRPRPLSPSQQRFWMAEQLGIEGGANVPVALRFDRCLDAERLEASLNQLVERHSVLRHAFEADGAGATQRLVDAAPIRVEKLRVEPSVEEDALDVMLAADWVWRPFDLARPPLLRAALGDTGDGGQVLLLVLHHLVCDGGSIGVLVDDLARFYSDPPLPAVLPERLPPRIDGGPTAEATDYWKHRLADVPATLELPLDATDRPREKSDVRAASRPLCLEVAAAVERLAQRLEATPFLVYLAAMQVVLSRYTGQTRIGVGSVVSGRHEATLREAVGCYINTAPLFGEVTADRFDDLLRRLRDDVLRDLDHARLPWEQIVEAAAKPRTPGRMPLVQAFFVHDDRPMASRPFGEAAVTDAATDYRGLGVFDLSLVVETSRPEPRVKLIHDGRAFPPGMAANFLESFVALIEAVGQRHDLPLDEAPVPAKAEAARLRQGGEPADREPVAHATDVASMLAQQAAATPDAIAVACRDDQLTFSELGHRSDQIAGCLAARGVGPGDRVGLLIHRGVDLPATIIAVWKLGAAYVPLDPAYPAARLALMAEDAELACVVASDELVDRAPGEQPVVAMSKLSSGPAPDWAPPSGLSDDRLAYVMYTSGSTGRPKGVMLPQRAVANLLASFADEARLGPGDVMLGSTTFCFDISVLEIFLPLVTGARLELADSQTVGDPQRLTRLLGEKPVSHLQGAPSTYRMLLAAGWRPTGGQTVLCGGEELTPDVAARLLETAGEVWNVYGPTETTIWSTLHKVTSADRAIPIGKPIARTRCYVLDGAGRLAATGVWGQLAIAGAGVADGYWNRPELTAERFPVDPFNGSGKERMYLTGDTARWNAAGVLEFGGRSDGQVKIRGHRVELREIEIALASHHAVGEAAVIASDQAGDNARLLAYVTPANGTPWTPEQLQTHLAGRLPGYMTPSAFVEMPRLPRTDNGKIDRNRLPRDPGSGVARSASTVTPSTPLEKTLAGWVEHLLRIDGVGVHDNFFEIGGQSLLATQLVVRIRDELGVEPPLREVYERPTIAEWAELIVRCRLEAGGADSNGSTNRGASASMLDQIEQMTDEQAAEFLRSLNR